MGREADSASAPLITPHCSFTLTFMTSIATPRTMKNPQVFVGAGFKPALRRKIDLIRPGNALGGFETRPYETVLRSNVCDVFHANCHGERHPER